MGYTVQEILDKLAEKYPDVEVRREDPHTMVREVAKLGQLNYRAPQHEEFRDRIKKTYRIREVEVVHTSTVEDVAVRAAEELGRMLRNYHIEQGKEKVHIGFAGGHSMRALARCFADELCRHGEDLPEEVVFHALAAGFHPGDPTTDPNAFFTYFLNEPVMQIKPRFLGLSAPAIVAPGHLESLQQLDDIRHAFKAARDIDIIVTSGSDWHDEHSKLRQRMQKSEQAMQTLDANGCQGDILWRPISRRGPIEAETEIRALTLVELTQLPEFIRQHKQILLMLAPCGACNRPKGALLKCILEQPQALVTNIVVDSRTASQLLRLAGNGGNDH
jgi:DNA-binding transcriptional regulator LsrR (DeoR family)